MGKYLDWYLVELEKNLDGRIGPEAAFELLNQTEDHIGMIKYELMISGMDELRAEEAAIQRFGDLDGLAARRKDTPVVRANWAAPVLLLLAGTALVGAAMVVGSVDSLMIAFAMGGASMVISAFLCARKGAFPGLAFGILLTVCFACLSVIASLEFYGPRLDLARRTERTKLMAALGAEKIEAQHNIHILRLGEMWAEGKLGRRVPVELRSSTGILVPAREQWGFEMSGTSELERFDSIHKMFLWPSTRLAYLSFTPTMTFLLHSEDAAERWRQFDREGFTYRRHDDVERIDDALATLAKNQNYDSDNVFAGLCLGGFMSLLWMILAFVLNRVANFDWTAEPEAKRTRPRVARS